MAAALQGGKRRREGGRGRAFRCCRAALFKWNSCICLIQAFIVQTEGTVNSEGTRAAKLQHQQQELCFPLGTACWGPPPFRDDAHPVFPPEYTVNPEYLEREIPKVYPGCSGVYPYHPFSLGFAINESSSGEAPSPPGISLQRGFRHIPGNCVPGNATTVSVPDGAGDFHQGYYTPLHQFIPPSFLTGIHYIPAPVSLNILAETTKEVHATEADSEDSGVVHERDPPPSSPE
ncbi:PREDICTED: doublesex- and mab-3-related transcription factor B1 [Corvus brachyrhynchos]|uniref:doublesex- and mab-3-related transcription factor B1 n=1 Tax=Corvus brachyrhynchos TaxID=85066 RepID=UPI00081643BA|nr:PREDICTED: doublesex- and mab-3-related transcription factor B1 [Corvus brachyrhynchos]